MRLREVGKWIVYVSGSRNLWNFIPRVSILVSASVSEGWRARVSLYELFLWKCQKESHSWVKDDQLQKGMGRPLRSWKELPRFAVLREEKYMTKTALRPEASGFKM